MGGRQAVFACYVAMLAFLTLLFSVVRGAPDAAALELPVLKVSAAPRQAFAPADVIVTVLAKPDARNRLLAVTIGARDSGFGSSTQRTLAGEDERGELARLNYRDVPAGTYQVVVSTFDRDGKLIAQRTADVKRISRFE